MTAAHQPALARARGAVKVTSSDDTAQLDLRQDFPLLAEHSEGLIYLDSAATAQKPRAVIQAVTDYYERGCTNVHRGIYPLAEQTTAAYEATRDRVARHVGAHHRDGVVFTRSCTEAINLVAQAWGREALHAGDELVVTGLEHHSNFLPWQRVAAQRDAVLRVAPLDAHGAVDLAALERSIGPRTRLVAVSALSNALGSVTQLASVVAAAHAADALVLVDGAQLVGHLPVDVARLGADFFAFSGHKMLGPTGVGVLVARPELLERMEPFLTGGEMVLDVTLDGARWQSPPHKFEAGTPPIAEVLGLGAAVEYIEHVGLDAIARHDRRLVRHGLRVLGQVPGVVLYGPPGAQHRIATFSFNLEDGRGGLIHPHDVGTVLADQGLAIRAGHHCAKPLMRHLGVPATCRASCHLYTAEADLDALAQGLERVRSVFG